MSGVVPAARGVKLPPTRILPSGLLDERIHACIAAAADARIEARVEGAIRVEPCEPVAAVVPVAAASEQGEPAANQDLPIRLDGQTQHVAVRAGIEARIERAVGVETAEVCDAASCRCRRQDRRERAADQDLPIRLQRERPDIPVFIAAPCRARIEARVERAVGIEPPDAAASCSGRSPRSGRRPECVRSGCTATALTVSFTPGSKPASTLRPFPGAP